MRKNCLRFVSENLVLKISDLLLYKLFWSHQTLFCFSLFLVAFGGLVLDLICVGFWVFFFVLFCQGVVKSTQKKFKTQSELIIQ